jgi:hypothetical protein
MKVKELIDQLENMDQELEVYLAIYHAGDSGEQDHYKAFVAVQYYGGKDAHVQIKGE